MPKSPTKRSTPKLSDLTQHVVAPKGVVSTGWPSVERKCADLGIRFRTWQPDVGRLILAKRADGKYAATIGGTGLSIPRQVGKTFLVGAIVFALCLLRPNLTVIWTAHRLRTSEETFKKLQAFAKRKRIAPHIAKIVRGSGEEAIEFRNGSRILFGAREREFGRGFDEVDVLIFDEAQILTENALDAMIPATNQSRQSTSALLLFMGTPPKPKDPGEVFMRMRTEALTGEDDDTGWVEFGADPGYVFTPLPAPLSAADWKQVAKANPSYPTDTPREAILRMRKKLGTESFRREGAGVYDDDTAKIIPELAAWSSRSTRLKRPAPAALAVAADLDQTWLSLGAASVEVARSVGRAKVQRRHLGSVFRVRVARRAEFVAEVKRIQDEHDIPVAVDVKGPAGFLIEDLRGAGVRVMEVGLEDKIQDDSNLCKAVQAGTVEHANDTDLNAAVEAVGWRNVGERRAFARKSGDISALESVALALGATARELEPSVYLI
jgi:hypothetical protein